MTEVETFFKAPKPDKRSRRRIPFASARRLAERDERDERAEVRRIVHERDGRCVGPARGLPGDCASPSPDRPRFEVNETHKRSTHPGSHLDPDRCVLLCQVHHDYCTSPTGEALVLVESLGLIVRSSK